MADLLVNAIIKAGTSFVKALRKVNTTRDDGLKIRELIGLVNAIVRTDVIPLQEDVRMENDPKMTLAMTRLKDALEKAEREVNTYLNTNVLLQAATVDDMTKRLGVLRRDIKDRMDVSLHAICNNTNSAVHKLGNGFDDLRADIRALRSSLNNRVNNREETDTQAVDKPPRVLTQFELRARQEDDTMRVCLELSIPLGIAAVLLRHCHWSPERVKKEWSEHGEKLRKAVGLPSSSDDVSRPKELSHSGNRQCNICYARTTMISTGCSHYYCKQCWSKFISVAVGRGTKCLSLRCPDPCCQMPVIQELVDKVVDDADCRARYARFASWSYVDDSGGRIKWCPGPDCGRAVEFLGAKDASTPIACAAAVVCDCKHAFCWSCGEEPHRPLSCATARFWLDTISSRSDWVLMFTKRCPKCLRTIENDQMTNYVTCCAPCGHRFCWICVGNHTAGCTTIWYWGRIKLLYWLSHKNDKYCETEGASMKRRELTLPNKLKDIVAIKEDEMRQAMASYHYQLWTANHASLQKVLEDMDELKKSWLLNMANGLGIQVTDLDFLIKAYEEIAECRRVIRWVYPYGYYYLDQKRDGDKCKQFDHLHKEANISLGHLQDSAVEDTLKLYNVEIESFAGEYLALKTNVMDLTREMRHKVEKLVKAVETDFQD